MKNHLRLIMAFMVLNPPTQAAYKETMDPDGLTKMTTGKVCDEDK